VFTFPNELRSLDRIVGMLLSGRRRLVLQLLTPLMVGRNELSAGSHSFQEPRIDGNPVLAVRRQHVVDGQKRSGSVRFRFLRPFIEFSLAGVPVSHERQKIETVLFLLVPTYIPLYGGRVCNQ